MSPAAAGVFDHAVHTANTWLADVAHAFGTEDNRFVHRALRAWLHALRDRLSVDSAAKFGAQLPELLRGTYYDGWDPSRTPVKYGPDQYISRFAQEARIPARDVPAAVATITLALADRVSPGQLAETLAQLPADLRALIDGRAGRPGRTGAEPGAPGAAGPYTRRPEPPRAERAAASGGGPGQDRLADLEEQVGTLTEAVRTLAHGLENSQMTGTEVDRVARAARLADEIILAGQAGRVAGGGSAGAGDGGPGGSGRAWG